MKTQQFTNLADQEQRFVAGQQAEISTQTGWTMAQVQEANLTVMGWMYKVQYTPSWDTNSGYTVVTGLAIREK